MARAKYRIMSRNELTPLLTQTARPPNRSIHILLRSRLFIDQSPEAFSNIVQPHQHRHCPQVAVETPSQQPWQQRACGPAARPPACRTATAFPRRFGSERQTLAIHLEGQELVVVEEEIGIQQPPCSPAAMAQYLSKRAQSIRKNYRAKMFSRAKRDQRRTGMIINRSKSCARSAAKSTDAALEDGAFWVAITVSSER
jgi:hypothetical protein